MRRTDLRGAALGLLAGLAGLALAGVLLRMEGVGVVLALLRRSGWALLADGVVHGGQLWLAGAAWRLVAGTGERPTVATFTALRWIREGINGLLPVLPVAGPFAGVRLLMRRGVPPMMAAAATIADTSVELATQVAFTICGVALLAASRGVGAVDPWMLAGVCGLTLAAALLVPAPWLLGRLATRLLGRQRWAGGMSGLAAATSLIWRDPRRVAAACALHLAAWVLGAAEVWLALRGFGQATPPWQCAVIESLGTAIRTAAVLVPAAVGVQEGGYVLVCGLFGVPPAGGLALSLFKRLRELAFGVPSLPAWFAFERRGRSGTASSETVEL